MMPKAADAPEFDYDLFVIGAGSGGVRASRMSASFGARVAVAEAYRAGGTCVIRGCVPKKLLVYASHFREDFEDAGGYGWSVGESRFSWPALIDAKNREIRRLEGIYEGLLTNAGVKLIKGRARIVDQHTVEVDGQRFTSRYLLIASGGWPVRPAIPGAELAITSNEAFELEALPKHILIVGGGYIAVEFAGIFHGLGSQVTLSYRGDEILRGFDDDLGEHLRTTLEAKGIRVLRHHDLKSIERRSSGLWVTATNRDGGSEGTLIDCDQVMFATGRSPNTSGIGLSEAGVKLDANNAVVVDEFSRSSVENIYAVGDVTDRLQLTPVAIREGSAVANTLFNSRPTHVAHQNIPSAVFSQPPIGTVGLTQAQALEKFGAVEVYKASFKPLKGTLSGRADRSLMKLLVEPVSQKVIGAHMIGADAPEIIQGIGIAVVAGLTKAQFDETVGIHPTAAEEFVTMREKTLIFATGQTSSG